MRPYIKTTDTKNLNHPIGFWTQIPSYLSKPQYSVYIGNIFLALGLGTALFFAFPLISQSLSVLFSILSLALTLSLTLVFSASSIIMGSLVATLGLLLIGHGVVHRNNERDKQIAQSGVISQSLDFLGYPLLSQSIKLNTNAETQDAETQYAETQGVFSRVIGLIDSGLSTTLDTILRYLGLKHQRAPSQNFSAEKNEGLLAMYRYVEHFYPGIKDFFITKIKPQLEWTADFVINNIVPPLAQYAGKNGTERVGIIIFTGDRNDLPALFSADKTNYTQDNTITVTGCTAPQGFA